METLKHKVFLIAIYLAVMSQITALATDGKCVGREEFEQRFHKLELELEQLRENNINLQTKVKALETEQMQATTYLADKPSTVPNQEVSKDLARRFVVDNESPAAFSVTISVAGLTNLGINQTIHFDKVVSNYGNHFDTRLNAFTAPVSGWYVFSLTLMSRPREIQYLYVVKNGNMVFHVYSSGTEYTTDSRTMVFHLDTGDEVWVQTSESSGYSKIVHGAEHTSFTGFLLYLD